MLRNADDIITGIYRRAWPMGRYGSQRSIEVRQLNDEEHGALERVAPQVWRPSPQYAGTTPNRIHMQVTTNPHTKQPALMLTPIYDEMLEMQLIAERN